MGFSTVSEISLILYILSFSLGWNWTVSWYERQEVVSSFSSCWRSAGSRPHEWGSGCVQTQHSGTTKVVVVIFKFLLLDLASSSVVIRPYHFSANLSYSSNKQGLGTTTCCYIKLFHSQTTLYMSRWFVTSLPTSPLCILLPLGLLASPQTFPIPQTSMDLVPQLVVILNFFTTRPHYICRDDLSPHYLPRLFASRCRSAFTPLRQPSLSLKQALTWSHNLHPASAVRFIYILYYPAQSCLEPPLFHYSFCGQIPIMLPF